MDGAAFAVRLVSDAAEKGTYCHEAREKPSVEELLP